MAYIKLGNMGRKRPIQDEAGGGSDLPEVTIADEGKILAVNASGEWAAQRNGKIDVLGMLGLYWTIDATYDDVVDMLNNGILPYFIGNPAGENVIYRASFYYLDNVVFQATDDSGNNVGLVLTMFPDNPQHKLSIYLD